MRTSRTVLVDVDTMRSGLKRDHERLSYQLKHQIMALFYGKGTATGSLYTVASLAGSPATTTKQGLLVPMEQLGLCHLHSLGKILTYFLRFHAYLARIAWASIG